MTYDMYDGDGDRDATRAYPPRSIFRTALSFPVDIFAQRQHVRVARSTLKAIDQEQSIAAVHHWTVWSSICGPYFSCHSTLSKSGGISTGGDAESRRQAPADAKQPPRP